MIRLFLPILVAMLSVGSAFAQNTGGVFPPGFGADHKSAQYRIAIDTDANRFNQRLHYQQSIDDHRLWRVLVQTRETATSDVDFDFVQAELFWEFTQPKEKYRTGIRFDARLRDDDRPGQVGVNWAHEWNFDDGWQARLVGLSSLQIGENRNDGISLQPRAHIAKALGSGPKLGIEYFGSLGNTENITISNARQTVGPFVSTKIAGKTTLYSGLQFGLTDVAPDTELRLWVTQGF